MRVLHVIAAALCLSLAGCGGGGGKVYPKSVAYMHEALSDVDELPPVFGSSAPSLSMDTSDASSVTWIVNLQGAEIMRFVGRLQAEGEKSTRLQLDLIGVTSGAKGNVQERLDQHPELRRLYLVAMTEQIESKLEERPFDITKTYGALARAAATNMGAIGGGSRGARN